MSPSQYEDTAVDSIEFEKLLDEQLKDIAENDSRSTAQSKAQAEINRRESDSAGNGDDSSSETSSDIPTSGPTVMPTREDGTHAPDPVARDADFPEVTDDPVERARLAGLNTEGLALDPVDHSDAQQRADAVNARGYMGTTPDPTPNENYTVTGVTSGAPTPETDAELYAKAQDAAVGNPLRDIDHTAAQNVARDV